MSKGLRSAGAVLLVLGALLALLYWGLAGFSLGPEQKLLRFRSPYDVRFVGPTAESKLPGPEDRLELLSIGGEISRLRESGERGSSETSTALAYLDVLMGNLESASIRYRDAARLGTDPSAAVNLGAVLLARFEAEDDPEVSWLIDALEVLGDSPDKYQREACFNRVRILLKLQLAQEAAAISTQCSEAPTVHRVDASSKPKADATVSTRKEFEALLQKWADGVRAVDGFQEERLLSSLRRSAQGLEMAEDLAFAKVVNELESANAEARSQFARALDLYLSASAAVSTYDYEGTFARFTEAGQIFSQLGSRLAGWSILEAARVAYHMQRPDQSLELLGGITLDDSQPVLEGRIRWVEAVVLRALGRPAESDLFFAEAIERYKTLGEPSVVAFLASNRANVAFDLGERARGWRFRLEALNSLDGLGPERLFTVLSGAAEVAVREGSFHAAQHFIRELELRLGTAEQELLQSLAELRLARLLARLGKSDEGRSYMSRASSYLETASQPTAFRERVEADVLLAEAELSVASGEMDEAVDRASELLTYFIDRDLPLDIAEVLMRRATLHLARGSRAEAQADLESAITQLEDGWLRLRPEQRPLYFERSKELFDARIALELEDGPEYGALIWAERSKARSVVAALEPDTSEAAVGHLYDGESLQPFLASLPTHQAVIEFAVLEDRVVGWLAREGKLLQVVRDVRRSDLRRSVERLRREVTRGSAVEVASAELFDLLLAPFESNLDGVEQLLLVPDGVLHELPFALLGPQGGDLLVERFELTFSPSLSGLALLLLKREARMGAPSSVLAVAYGKRPTSLPELADLQFASLEAATVADMYPQAVLLTGGESTLRRVRSELLSQEVVHLAAHAVASANSVTERWILLAPDSEANAASDRVGRLTAAEFSQLDLEGTRLVVLSACSTAFGGPPLRDGLLGLVNPVLSAGVPNVVASLWPTDDRGSHEFFVSFHRNLRTGLSPSAALRRSQLESMSNSENTVRQSVWAAFQVFGSSTINNIGGGS